MTGSQADTSSVVALAKNLFPYKFKYDQKEKLEELTAASQSLFSAPTGYGKATLALVSALAHLMQPNSDIATIIVLVKTKTQIFRIIDECATIIATARKKQYFQQLYTLPLLAKDELCIHETHPKGYIHCEKLQCRYYPKQKPLPAGSMFQTLLTEYNTKIVTSSSDLKTYLTTISNGCCPYYLLRKILTHARIIVTTHAWLLNPSLRQVLFIQLPINPINTALIIDEVHNFITPYKTEITAEDLVAAVTVAQKYHFECQTFLEKLLPFFKLPIKDFSHFSDPKPEPWRINQLMSASTKLHNLTRLTSADRKGLSGLQALVTLFRSEGDYWYCDHRITKEGKIKKVLGHIQVYAPMYFRMISPFKRLVFMSGTLYNLQLYKLVFDLTGITLITAKPPTQTTFFAVFVNAQISSRQQTRSLRLFRWQVLASRKLHTVNPGHTLIFSPSHQYTQYLAKLHTHFYPDDHIYVEDTSLHNQSILSDLRTQDHELIYATFGGSFSEGVEIIDPKTKHSKIALIIFTGLPIPPPTSAQTILKYAYSIRFNKSLAQFLVETLPAYHMIIQAAGRGMRRPSDKCAIICLDYRLVFTKIFSQEKMIKINQLTKLSMLLERFYNN